MSFTDEMKNIYSNNGVEFPNVEITPFMEDFIQRMYKELKSGSPKYSDYYTIAELFMVSYEKSLINNARISFSDKVSNAKLISSNCDCVDFVGNDGIEKKISLPLSKVVDGFKKNSSMRSSAGPEGPKGLQDIIDGFQIFWQKTEWSAEGKIEGTCKPDTHTVDCDNCDDMENTPKVIVNDNTDESKEELKNAFKNFFIPKHTYKREREIILLSILIELSQSLEKHFNGYYGEYYGFDCSNKSKLLKLDWNSIKYSTVNIVEDIVERKPIGEVADPDDYDHFAIDPKIVTIHIGDPTARGFKLHDSKDWIDGNESTGRKPLKNFINLTLYEPSGKATSTFIKNGSPYHPKTGNQYYTMVSETTGRSLEWYETITVFNDGHIELFQVTTRPKKKTAEQKVLEKLKDVNYAFSGSDVLILEGKHIDLSGNESLQKDKGRPKTSIGFHNNILYVAVTVPKKKAQNWKIWQNTLTYIQPDATWISFDGGGSSTMVVNGELKFKGEKGRREYGRAISTVLSWEE